MANDEIIEEWRPVQGYPGYEVSSLGRVRSRDRLVKNRYGLRRAIGQILAPAFFGSSKEKERKYLLVALSGENRTVHSLVCEAFHGPKPTPSHEVAHWDGNPQNNCATNLRWSTPLENSADTERQGRNKKGEERYNAIFTANLVREMRRRHGDGESMAAIAKSMDANYWSVRAAIQGMSWKHI